MELKFICPHWGSKHLDFNEFLIKVKESGYDRVEMSLPLEESEKVACIRSIKKHRLMLIAQHWETVTPDFQEHKREYRKRLVNLASANPMFINSQTGRDFFTFNQNAELIEIASEVSQQYGVKIIHETHRGRFSFAAHITVDYLMNFADLRLGFDLSHWCNVAESYLQDQLHNVEPAISRADHIHARIGFPEGPQVSDPRLPEWKEAIEIHRGWWKQIIEKNRNEGRSVFTITPEFGPFPYMPLIPFTKQPITNQWEVNIYMMNHLKEYFNF